MNRLSPAVVRLVGLLGLLGLLLGGAHARAEVAVPPLSASVTDLTATLDDATRRMLADSLAALEQRTGSQLAVLLVPSTQPESIEQFAIRVAEVWKLGRKGVDDGILFLVALDDRAVRIEVGYGLEGVVPDVVAKRVLEERVLPNFRDGDFQGGVEAGVTALIRLVDGEPLAPPAVASGRAGGDLLDGALPMIMTFVFIAGNLLRALFGSLIGALVAGAVAFAGAWMLLGSALAAVVVGFVVFVLTVLGVASVGRGGGARGGSGGARRGGGFSGGGGGFGGGGASGRW